MKYHVFELSPSEEMGIPVEPLTIDHKVSEETFLDYEDKDFIGLDINKLIGVKLQDTKWVEKSPGTSICLIKKKLSGLVICFVKQVGRVILCKEVDSLLADIKEAERILKKSTMPLETGDPSIRRTANDEIHKYLGVFNLDNQNFWNVNTWEVPVEYKPNQGT